ncbi:MAG: O-antigen ligase family protein, partial [Desulfosarcina sp.]
YRPQVAGQTGWKAEVVDDCHNQYLRIAVEHGVVGLLVFFAFIVACFTQVVPHTYKLLGIGTLLAWCATSFFSGHFATGLEGRLIYIWLGSMLAMPVVAPPTIHMVDPSRMQPKSQISGDATFSLKRQMI